VTRGKSVHSKDAATEAPLARLRWHYEHRLAAAIQSNAEGTPVVGVTSNVAPWELLRAAGFFPVLLSAPRAPTPLADKFMEPVFDPRIRGIFDRVLAGEWSFLRSLVISRTSEQEYKLFLYLREVDRRNDGYSIPPLQLFDLLHSRSPRSRAHGLHHTRQLKKSLEQLAGRAIRNSELRKAIRESNAARKAIRRLLSLRRKSPPRITGAEAVQAIGAWRFMDRGEYTRLATLARRMLAKRPALDGPRIMIKGSPVDHPCLHRMIEAHGAVVVAEDDWWGSRASGRDIDPRPDPITAIFRKYYLDEVSPRVFPFAEADRWFCREVFRSVDGVVFYLPPDDAVLGWDYPRQRRFLDHHGIPSVLVNQDVATNPPSELKEQIEEFVARLAKRVSR
jgi:benzoyl-CoA reductase subunit C